MNYPQLTAVVPARRALADYLPEQWAERLAAQHSLQRLGRLATFEFDLPNGEYNVILLVGWYGRTYLDQKAAIEGASFVNDEATTPANPYLVHTKCVDIGDHKLTLTMGILNEYTMINHLDIEAAYVLLSNLTDLRMTVAIIDANTLTATLRWTLFSAAVTTTLHCGSDPITDLNWNDTITPTTNAINDYYTAVIPHANGVQYFALKSLDTTGIWSGLSNNALLSYHAILLPVIRR